MDSLLPFPVGLFHPLQHAGLSRRSSGASSTLRSSTLNELREIDLAKAGRVAVYSFGAVEGILLDRLNLQWKSEYFQHTLTTDPLFALSTR
jgi:hypothetical protein